MKTLSNQADLDEDWEKIVSCAYMYHVLVLEHPTLLICLVKLFLGMGEVGDRELTTLTCCGRVHALKSVLCECPALCALIAVSGVSKIKLRSAITNKPIMWCLFNDTLLMARLTAATARFLFPLPRAESGSSSLGFMRREKPKLD